MNRNQNEQVPRVSINFPPGAAQLSVSSVAKNSRLPLPAFMRRLSRRAGDHEAAIREAAERGRDNGKLVAQQIAECRLITACEVFKTVRTPSPGAANAGPRCR